MAKTHKLPIANDKKPVPVKIVSEAVPASNDKYKIEDALRTLKQAEVYKADKGLMKDVKKLAKQETKALGKIC